LQVVVVVALLDKLLTARLGMPLASWLVVLQQGLPAGRSHYWMTAGLLVLTEVQMSLCD